MSRRKEIPNLIKKIMLLLAAVQVLLGGMWMVCNLTFMPDFQETRDALKASETFLFDEYMGVLYPVLLRLFSVFGTFFYVPVYVLQVGVATWSYYYLLRSFVGSGWFVWLGVGYLVTFPMILQCHMSVLPYSLAISLLVILIPEIKGLMEKKETIPKKRLFIIAVLWLLIGLLVPDYGVIAAFLVVPGFVLAAWKQKKRLLLYFCVALVTMATIFTTLSLAQTPGSYGRVQRSVNSVLWTRFAWPYFERDGYYWDHKTWITFEEDEWGWASMYPENAIYEFGPKIERVVGKEKANDIFGEMAKFSSKIGKKEHLLSLGRDVLANAGGPFAIQYQLSGRGVSYTGWNYYQMQGNTPDLTRYFVKYALCSFGFMFVVTICIFACKRKRYEWSKIIKKTMPVFLTLGVMVLWYTMTGNGMQDYLKVMPVLFAWCILPVLGLGALIQKNGNNGIE